MSYIGRKKFKNREKVILKIKMDQVTLAKRLALASRGFVGSRVTTSQVGDFQLTLNGCEVSEPSGKPEPNMKTCVPFVAVPLPGFLSGFPPKPSVGAVLPVATACQPRQSGQPMVAVSLALFISLVRREVRAGRTGSCPGGSGESHTSQV